MPVQCNFKSCEENAVLKRPKTGHALCKEHFFNAFELEVHFTIVLGKLFKRGDRVAIGASGGKDSTVLAYILKKLNDRYDYGLDLFLLSIDEGISGYRDDSLETVKKNRDDYQIPLKILSYKDLYGWTMDEIVKEIGLKNNCTFCGVFRRQALDRGAAILNANMIVTGHNADDTAETVLMNILRGDLARLQRCTNLITAGEGTISRCKPLMYAYEKEIVMYAYYKNLVYFSTECIYSPNAYRGHVRAFLKDIERVKPTCILDIINSGEQISANDEIKFPDRRMCTLCGFIASQEICKACVLLEGLNRGIPKLGIGKSNKAKKILGIQNNEGSKEIIKTKCSKNSNKLDNGCSNKSGCSSSCKSANSESIDLKKNSELINTESEVENTLEKNKFYILISKLKLEQEFEKVLGLKLNSPVSIPTKMLNLDPKKVSEEFNKGHNLSNKIVVFDSNKSTEKNPVVSEGSTFVEVETDNLNEIPELFNTLKINENEQEENPVIIKSNAKRVRPKILLPEMITKSINKLEF